MNVPAGFMTTAHQSHHPAPHHIISHHTSHHVSSHHITCRELHARGSALVAGAYALTLVANASSNATGFTGAADILTMHARLQATLNGILGNVNMSV
jgi:hypothetical protein